MLAGRAVALSLTNPELHAYECPLAVAPGGAPEVVPNWQDTHAMHTNTCVSHLGKWIRTDLGARGSKWFVALLATSALSASFEDLMRFLESGATAPQVSARMQPLYKPYA